ncbi:MAG: winged helix-turn-helix domain-containing protein, partial [bacterium]
MEMNNGLNIDISRPAPLYLQVKQNILQLIDRGELKDGDRLPPEIELARICNLSRGTVRMALSELAREGLVSRSPKRGSF